MNDTVIETRTWRQLVALFRMELVLLRRNKLAALFLALLPLAIGYFRLSGHSVESVGDFAAVTRLASTLGVIMVIFFHHHVVSVYAGRRQEFVLKRLRAGLSSDWTIITGAASTTGVLFLVQALLIAVFAVLALGFPLPANPLVVLLAILLGLSLMTTVSAILSAVTRSSEAAMLTSMPTMLLFLTTPGLLVPYDSLPDEVEAVAWFTPMGPFGELIRTSWLGQDANGGELSLISSVVEALPGLAVMLGWLVLTMLAVRRFFRWEPRHT